jgi:hypothetical protein
MMIPMCYCNYTLASTSYPDILVKYLKHHPLLLNYQFIIWAVLRSSIVTDARDRWAPKEDLVRSIVGVLASWFMSSAVIHN